MSYNPHGNSDVLELRPQLGYVNKAVWDACKGQRNGMTI